MSKRYLLIFSLLAIFLPVQVLNVVASTSETVSPAPSEENQSVTDSVSESTSKLADVSGIVLLRAQRKTFPDNLTSLFTGSKKKLPKQRKLKVSGEYKGGSVVTVVETAKSGEPEFSFDLPIVASVMTTLSSKLTKETLKNQSVTMTFTNSNNTPSVVDSATHKFTGRTTNKRLNNKGSASGNFNEKGAKGRFLLKLDFNVD